jgi:hypothetical protein
LSHILESELNFWGLFTVAFLIVEKKLDTNLFKKKEREREREKRKRDRKKATMSDAQTYCIRIVKLLRCIEFKLLKNLYLVYS